MAGRNPRNMKRSQPTPRTEGMANIVAATVRLLETRSPQEITLRDVATESGHGHRLIVEWFGGKGGLFLAVFTEIFERLRSSGELFYANVPLRTDVRVAFQLFNYMQMHHKEYVESVRDSFVLEAVRGRLQDVVGLAEQEADMVARKIAVLSLGISLFGDFFDLTEDEAIAMMQDFFRAMTGVTFSDRPPANPA